MKKLKFISLCATLIATVANISYTMACQSPMLSLLTINESEESIEWKKPMTMSDMMFLFDHQWDDNGVIYAFDLSEDGINVRYETIDILSALFGGDAETVVYHGKLKLVKDDPSLGFIEFYDGSKLKFNIIGVSKDKMMFKLDDGRIFKRKDSSTPSFGLACIIDLCK